MAIKTTLEQLESVQAAIAAIESGAQDYTIEGRRVTKADLRTLYQREERLKSELAAENNGSTAYAAYPGWVK